MDSNRVLRINLPHIFLIAFGVLLSIFLFFSNLNNTTKTEIISLTNGLGSLVYLSIWYFIFLNKETFEFNKQLFRFSKVYYLFSKSTVIVFGIGFFLLLISTEFKNYFILLNWIDQFLFAYYFVLIFYRYMGYSQNFNIFIIAISLLQGFHNILLRDQIELWKLLLNPFSSWSYLSWFYENMIYLFILPIKWLGIIIIYKKSKSSQLSSPH